MLPASTECACGPELPFPARVYTLSIYSDCIVDGIGRTNMVGFPPGIARCHRLPGRVSGLAMAIGLLVAGCGPAHPASNAGPTAGATAGTSSTTRPSRGSTADSNSVTTCYTPQQLPVAYSLRP